MENHSINHIILFEERLLLPSVKEIILKALSHWYHFQHLFYIQRYQDRSTSLLTVALRLITENPEATWIFITALLTKKIMTHINEIACSLYT